jgi:hypothetical protein
MSNILVRANEIVNLRSEEKERQYGPFHECNERIAALASIMIQKKITAEDIYYIQMAIKLGRQSFNHKQDNLLDLVAYAAALNNFKEDERTNQTGLSGVSEQL